MEASNENARYEPLPAVQRRLNKTNFGERLAFISHVKKSPIKRTATGTLKRPHSNEVQSVLAASYPEQRQENIVNRRPILKKSLQERLQSPDSEMISTNAIYTDHTLAYLLQVERPPLAVPAVSEVTRACVISWYMKVIGPSGDSGIVQSACWYFDSFVGTNHVVAEHIGLMSAACLWIAQKLHGPRMPAKKLVHYANYVFTGENLIAAEKTVLRKLRFPVHPVIPNSFIPYLAWWCDRAHSEDIQLAATFICMAAMMLNKSLCEVSPSLLGCLAVKHAVFWLKNMDMMMRLQDCPMYKAATAKTPTSKFNNICATMRETIRTIAKSNCPHKILLQYYGGPPGYIAQRVIKAAGYRRTALS